MMVFGPKLRSRLVMAPSSPAMMEPDADDGAGADDHAEHGEEGAHLVLAGGGERQAHSAN